MLFRHPWDDDLTMTTVLSINLPICRATYVYIYISIMVMGPLKKIMAMDQYTVSDKTYHHNHASFLCQSLCFTDHPRITVVVMLLGWPDGHRARPPQILRAGNLLGKPWPVRIVASGNATRRVGKVIHFIRHGQGLLGTSRHMAMV